MEIVKKMLARDRRALARVISLIEDRGEHLPKIIEALYSHTGRANILGITGPPGAGKSTCTDKLVAEIRKTGKRVAVVAIDPSSPFSGGAILGDRIRMQAHSGDEGVYIRSLGTRGKHGGLSQSSKEVVLALDAAGFDWIIVETAGVGQTELDILKLAHIVLVVLVPESGDGIQVMKAGLMEIADVFAVNKSDRPEADNLVRELTNMIGLSKDKTLKGNAEASAWTIPVVKTQALFDRGIDELFSQVQAFAEYLSQSGLLEQKKAQFIEEEIKDIVWNRLKPRIEKDLASATGKASIKEVVDRNESPYAAARELMKRAGLK